MTILGTKTHNSKEGALHCAVTFNNRLHLIESFQVMTDRAGTSRLEWRHWDQFTKMPVGKELNEIFLNSWWLFICPGNAYFWIEDILPLAKRNGGPSK